MPLTITANSVAQLLKQDTYLEHQQSEKILLPFLQRLSSRREYASLLYTFYGFFHPLEELIAGSNLQTILTDLPERRNSRLIIDDLLSIGLPHKEISLCKKLPQVSSLASAAGALYVLEGSTLGGRVISNMLLKNSSLGLSVHNLNFFSGYKEETGARWTAFLAMINQLHEETPEVIRAARETFNCFSLWMQKSLQ